MMESPLVREHLCNAHVASYPLPPREEGGSFIVGLVLGSVSWDDWRRDVSNGDNLYAYCRTWMAVN